MPDWVTAGFDDYIRRLPPHVKFTLKEVRAEIRHDGMAADDAITKEGERIMAAVPQGAVPIVLDERGKSLSSMALARLWAHWHAEAVHPAIIIGGADGIAAQVKQSAQAQWSLSALTLPHALVRVLIAEQLYRAYSIHVGHPYHRP
jgi:23S rRNA (pseudouridine1915-N3)-methyltransferase